MVIEAKVTTTTAMTEDFPAGAEMVLVEHNPHQHQDHSGDSR
jgi:hypothetical protein